MALTVGTNCYVTRAEANTYFGDRLDAALWTAADDATKDQALVTATMMIDTKTFVGYATDSDQALAFPRVGQYFDERVGAIVVFDEDVVPDRIKKATYEQALHLLTNRNLLDDTGNIRHLAVTGVARMQSITSPDLFGDAADFQMQPLIERGAASLGWWRAN